MPYPGLSIRGERADYVIPLVAQRLSHRHAVPVSDDQCRSAGIGQQKQ